MPEWAGIWSDGGFGLASGDLPSPGGDRGDACVGRHLEQWRVWPRKWLFALPVGGAGHFVVALGGGEAQIVEIDDV